MTHNVKYRNYFIIIKRLGKNIKFCCSCNYLIINYNEYYIKIIICTLIRLIQRIVGWCFVLAALNSIMI